MNEVTLYTLSTCPWCRKSKNYFLERGIHFEFQDYDLADEETQEKITRIMEQHQASAFPFAIINGKAIEGYNPARYASLLGLAG
jgi:glutaredoxin